MQLQKTLKAPKNLTKKFILGLVLAAVIVTGTAAAPKNVAAATTADILAMITEILRVVDILKARMLTGTSGVPAGLPGVSDKFTESVAMGAVNDSVKFLQTVFATNPAIAGGVMVTGTFGSDTEAAIRSFQMAYKLPVTGTFTPVTEYVLNSVLTAIPLSSYTENYLTQTVVKQKIDDAANAYLLGDTRTVAGNVTLKLTPEFSATVKTSDTATLQRIMKTSPLLYTGEVNGVMDTQTVKSVIRLRIMYGIQYTVPVGGVVELSELMNTKTITLLNRILIANDSGTIKPDLLQRSETTPATLMPNSDRGITFVRALRNYRNNNTEVTITYEGNITEKFKTIVVAPGSAVIADIAGRLGRANSDVSAVINFDSIHGQELDKIEVVFKEYKLNEIDIDVTNLDKSTSTERIGTSEIALITAMFFGGDDSRWIAARDKYIEDAKIGTTSNELYDFVAMTLGRPLAEIKNIMTVKVLTVDPDPGSIDPCAGGGCGG